jgi:hypothetical protein
MPKMSKMPKMPKIEDADRFYSYLYVGEFSHPFAAQQKLFFIILRLSFQMSS